MKKSEKPKVVVIQAPSDNDDCNDDENSIFSDNNLDIDIDIVIAKKKNPRKKHKFESLEIPLETTNPIELIGIQENKGHYFGKELELMLKDP